MKLEMIGTAVGHDVMIQQLSPDRSPRWESFHGQCFGDLGVDRVCCHVMI